MLAPVDEPLIRALQLDAPCRIADVACGGGSTTRALLRRSATGSIVHGFDISPSVIELACSRIPSGSPDIAFHVGDMATATPPNERYDRLTSRFGVMFFDDPLSAFANLLRWLAPRGRFAFAVWGPVDGNPWMSTVRDAVAKVTEVPSPDPAAPGPFRYAEIETLLTLLARVGFDDLRVNTWRGALPLGVGLPTVEAAAFALSAFASFGEMLAKAGGTAFDDARQLLTVSFARMERDAVLRMDACVHVVSGGRS